MIKLKENNNYTCYMSMGLLLSCLLKTTLCTENTDAEVYFIRSKPINIVRNEVVDRRNDRNGPVIFPVVPDEDSAGNRNRFVVIPKSNPVNNHPYTKVSRKYKLRRAGRFGNQDDQMTSRDYQALARHGTKVLKIPLEKLRKDHISVAQDIQRRKNYAFSYKVVDHLSGDDFSHSQIRNSKATNGEYRVKLPDGRVQIVSYTADKNGYKADVRYTENDNDGVSDQRGIHQQDPAVQIQRIPVHEIHPTEAHANQLKYYDELEQHDNAAVKLKAPISTQSPRFSDYHGIVVTPSPGYSNGVVTDNRNLQVPLPLNVEIYTTNARDFNIGRVIPFVSSTPTYNTADIYDNQIQHISPHIHSNGNHGLILSPTPSSFVLRDQHGQVIDNIKLVTSTAIPVIFTPTTASPFSVTSGHYNF